jgi:hypothetical protein
MEEYPEAGPDWYLTKQSIAVLITRLGDGTEPYLDKYFKGYCDNPGYYWIVEMLSPGGPFETKEAAFTDFETYIDEK